MHATSPAQLYEQSLCRKLCRQCVLSCCCHTKSLSTLSTPACLPSVAPFRAKPSHLTTTSSPQVLRCLVAHYKQLAGGCQDELSRGVRRALWAFKLGAPLTKVCDSDVLVSGRGGVCGRFVGLCPAAVFVVQV